MHGTAHGGARRPSAADRTTIQALPAAEKTGAMVKPIGRILAFWKTYAKARRLGFSVLNACLAARVNSRAGHA
jgi:hypothetical protein